jgi:predicted PurR-regulated permease PerM
MHTDTGFSSAARFLLVAGAFVVVVAGMRAAAPLITPFLLSVFIAVIAAPPMFYLVRRGLPSWAAMLAVTFVVAAIGAVIVALVSGSLASFTNNLPEYQGKLKLLTGDFLDWLEGLGIHLPRQALTTYLDAGKAMKVAGTLIGGLGDILANAFLILLTVVFILFEAAGLPAKLHAALKTPDASMAHLHQVLDNINQYMMLKTLMSLLTGVLVWSWLWVLGVDFPVLWGLVAFLLNYVPNIGSIIAAVPAVLLALVQLGPETAFWVAVGYLAVNTLVGNLIEPRFMGRGLGLSTLIVFLSLVFWGWVLGAAGMFLSVPLTMALKIALDANPQTRPIAVMLGPEITHPPGDEAPAKGASGA